MAALGNVTKKCHQIFEFLNSARLPRGLCRYLSDGSISIHTILNNSRIDSEVKFSVNQRPLLFNWYQKM